MKLEWFQIIFFFYFFHFIVCQNDDHVCPCNRRNYRVAWGQFSVTRECQGICDLATEVGRSECYANSPSGTSYQQMCERERKCVNLLTCEGSWTPWSKIGDCSDSCAQMEVRYCSKIVESSNVRVSTCLGGQGHSDQVRFTDCYHGDCRQHNITTTSTIATTTKSATTTRRTTPETFATTTTMQRIIQSPTIRLKPKPEDPVWTVTDSPITTTIKEKDPQMLTKTTTKPNSTLNTIILPAVLGSVGFICLAVVVIAGVITCSKNRKAITEHPYTQGKISETSTSRTENYEVVGPPLPERPLSMQIPSAPPLEFPENVRNMLYHTVNVFSEDGTHPNESPKTGTNGYLIPLNNRNSVDPDSVYSHIDDRK